MSKLLLKKIIKNMTKPNTHKIKNTNVNIQYTLYNPTPMKEKTPISWTTPKHKRMTRSNWINKVN